MKILLIGDSIRMGYDKYVKEKLGADGKIAIGPVEDLNCNHTYLTIDEFLKITKPEEEK